MDEIVAQVRRVNDLIAEISAASREQSSGIGQIGEAVSQLDQVTQQNAALVEEMAAAADSLKSQAARMTGAVAVFRVAANAPAHPEPVPRAVAPTPPRSPQRPSAVRAPAAPAARALPPKAKATKEKATAEADWEAF
jgi:methyl-accepting chemotaxis protein